MICKRQRLWVEMWVQMCDGGRGWGVHVFEMVGMIIFPRRISSVGCTTEEQKDQGNMYDW